MPNANKSDFILGIDLGSNSVGWALVRCSDGNPSGLVRVGSRVFDAGMEGTSKDFETGKEKSRNIHRREMRHQRRQTWRRARRMKKIFGRLQTAGLLPLSKCTTPAERQDLLNTLDKQIRESEWFQRIKSTNAVPEPEQVFPYLLRDAALNEPLEPNFLGRALYHLAQRRGFKSNRKQTATNEKDDDEGKVKPGIETLRGKMQGQTLGTYLSHSSPSQERIRGAGRWTGREMFTEEFEKIWNAQKSHRPEILTDKLKEDLSQALFFQRPLKLQTHLIGFCELEPTERRAPLYLLSSQRFRLLQKVNDLRVELPNGRERLLTAEERTTIIGKLDEEGDQTFGQIRRLPELHGSKFTLERDSKKPIIGNRTASKFRRALTTRWDDLSHDDRNALVDMVYEIEDDDKLKNAVMEKWRLDPEEADKLIEIKFEPDYLKLSQKAVAKLLPLLEIGFSYGSLAPYYAHLSSETLLGELFSPLEEGLPHKEACQRVFSVLPVPTQPPVDVLPPVAMELREIRNPAVMRSLTELRKVVNAIIRKYGKPAEIRIELAKELKKPKWRRGQISKRNEENRAERDSAKKEIREATNDEFPRKYDIRKVLLARECGQHCVYCGHPLARGNFFGDDAQIDIDHIIPRSLLWDDSFTNLVVCHAKCNREKGNKTPAQAFSGDALENVLDRVRKFSGNDRMKREKLRRFTLAGEELQEFLKGFTRRQLNDTAYASKLAKRYLGLLYGGEIDADGKRCVTATSGGVTWDLRRGWELNSILNDGPTTNGGTVPKKRDDHRHHAVDAVVIALTEDKSIQKLNQAAALGQSQGDKDFAKLEGPWPDFVDTVRAEIEIVIVSHRVSKKVSGALHKETLYSREIGQEKKRRLRVALTDLSEKDVMSESVIADKGVRSRVQEKLVALGGGEPKKQFANPENVPYFEKGERRIPIKKVRVNETVNPKQIGKGRLARYVKTGGNHHLEIFGERGRDGHDKKWDTPGVVTMMDAYERQKKHEPIVRKRMDDPWEFRFSVAAGEILECDDGPGRRRLLVVRSISEEEKTGSVKINLAALNDARLKDEIIRKKQWITKSPNELRKWNARKVNVSPLGEVSESHD